MLVSVGALKATDHRVAGSTRSGVAESYSSIRKGILNAATAEDGDDDWD